MMIIKLSEEYTSRVLFVYFRGEDKQSIFQGWPSPYAHKIKYWKHIVVGLSNILSCLVWHGIEHLPERKHRKTLHLLIIEEYKMQLDR